MLAAEMNDHNSHMHRCSCGFIWRHSNDMAGNEAAHTCPNCSKQIWWHYLGNCKAMFVGCCRPVMKKGQKLKAVAANCYDTAMEAQVEFMKLFCSLFR